MVSHEYGKKAPKKMKSKTKIVLRIRAYERTSKRSTAHTKYRVKHVVDRQAGVAQNTRRVVLVQ